jgi:hypothetical protein
MTAEKAFYYYLAIYGTPANVVERYGSYFDATNYARAMADEFQRAKYRQGIQAKIANEVKNLNYSDKFTFIGSAASTGYTALGEYSFESHSFPIGNLPTTGFCIDAARSFFGNCTGTVLRVDVFRLENAVNRADFKWSLPMSETEASAFVKSRAMAGSGSVDRKVTAKITYSVVNMKGQAEDSVFGRAASFCPFIHSVEIYGDPGLTKKLGVITGKAGMSESAFGPERAREAQSPSKVIGEYQYIADYREDTRGHPNPPILGTIKLTDVGVELSGEQRNGKTKALSVSFFESFAAENPYNVRKLSRLNFTFGVKDFRIVWNFDWNDNHTPFVFDSPEERDRFFVDVAKAMQEWAIKYSQFAVRPLNVDQQVYRQ